jgi:hypothetical protein
MLLGMSEVNRFLSQIEQVIPSVPSDYYLVYDELRKLALAPLTSARRLANSIICQASRRPHRSSILLSTWGWVARRFPIESRLFIESILLADPL